MAFVEAGFAVSLSITIVEGVYTGGSIAARTTEDRPWVRRRVTGTDPAANVEAAIAVPARAEWDVLSFHVSLVTDANVANRVCELDTLSGTDVIRPHMAGLVQAASTTRRYVFADHGQLSTTPLPNNDNLVPLSRVHLSGKQTLTTTTLNRQATDNYGVPVASVLERVVEGYAAEATS